MKRIILLLISAFVLACSVMTIVGGKETDNFIKYAEFNVTADALQKPSVTMFLHSRKIPN